MDTVESLTWLKSNNLYRLAENFSLQIKKVFSPCLNVKDEKILVIGDIGFGKNNIAGVSCIYGSR